MAELLLVNPRRRKKRKTGVRRKLSALQQKYFGKKRRRRSTTASAAPARRRRRRRSTVVAKYANNPRRRITRSFRRRAVGYTSGAGPIRRRKLNPSFRGSLKSIPQTAAGLLRAGGVGAVGALGLDMMWGYGKRWLPASVAGSPIAQYAVKLLGAIAVGMVGERVLRGKGRDLAVGATTVVLHDALKAQVAASFPGIQLGEYLTYAPTVGTMDQAGRLLSSGMGEYLSGIPQAVGYNAEDASGYYGDGNGDFTGDGLSGS